MAPYVPLRATSSESVPSVDLSILYNERFAKLSFAITYIIRDSINTDCMMNSIVKENLISFKELEKENEMTKNE